MNCQRCGAVLSLSPGAPAVCGYCGLPVAGAGAGADPRVAALMVDANHNGIPDVIERMAAVAPGGGELALGGSGFRSQPAVDLSFVPPAPRQPSAQARELVYRYQGSQKVRLILGIVMTLVTTLSSFIFCWGVPVDIALSLSGQRGTGTVVSTELQTNVRINNRHPTLIHFRYSVDGASQEGSSSTLDSALISRATPGASVPIEYLPSIPDWVRIPGSTYSTFGTTTLFVLLFPIAGFLIGLSAIRSNRREIRAFERGTPIVARVTFQGPDTSTKLNGRHPFLLRWGFDVQGRPFSGSISHMEPSALRPLVRGDQILVLFDPSNPAINTVYVA